MKLASMAPHCVFRIAGDWITKGIHISWSADSVRWNPLISRDRLQASRVDLFRPMYIATALNSIGSDDLRKNCSNAALLAVVVIVEVDRG
jgi:hypothetical protein